MRSAASSLATILVLTSCTGTIRSTVNVTYLAPSGVTLTRLAILPVMSAEGLEGFRRIAADILAAAVPQERPEIVVIPAGEALSALNEAGLAQDYSQMVTDYERTGILDKETLAAMGEAVGANHLLHMRARYWERPLTEDFVQILDVSGHIWSTEKGDVVWEASANVERPVNDEIESRRPMGELLAVACRLLMAQLP